MDYKKLCRKYLRSIKSEKVSSSEIAEYHQMVREEIAYLIDSGERDRLSSALTLGIGVHLEEVGKQMILDGNVQGWKLLEQELIWFAKSIMEERQDISLDARNFGGVIGMAMYWQYWDLAEGVAAAAQRTFQAYPERFHNQKTIHVFVAALYYRYINGKLPDFFSILPQDHLYQNLMSNWHDINHFTILLDQVCDFHVFSVHDDQKDKMVELLAFDFIPFDLHAIGILRDKEGLPMPTISHPLMESALGKIPTQRPGYDSGQDELLQLLLRQQR